MGHRHVFSPSYIFETENDQRWNMTEHPYVHTAHSDAVESSSHTYPENNMSIDGEQYSIQCIPAPVSNSYSSLAHNVQTLHYEQDRIGPSNLLTSPENNGNFASSSNYNEHHVHQNDSSDIRGSNGRWHYKRKTPCDPADNHVGSSSEISMRSDPWEETSNMDFLHTPWDYPIMKGGHGGESSFRNVRSRVAPNSPSHDCTTSHSMDVFPSGSMREWSPTHISSSINGQELNPFHVEGSSSSQNGLITRSNHVQGTQLQSIRGTRSNYVQRSAPTFRASSSTLQLGHSDEGLRLAPESHSSRLSRPLPTITWCSSDRNARTRMSIERYRSFYEVANFRDQPAPSEGLVIMDRSAYVSGNPLDHHQDMRLDIDDMSYEELLELGERIGSVSTGLSEDLISKCLRESVYCSSDEIQDEGSCVICLEEYVHMDDVGMLKGCKHDFHVGCIKKWLSMKNLCPICKSEPMKHK
uniref:E3 ubiquitin-protein ligase MBR1-like n=1 Tax=Erigeron canadensis TaxID=72917 RepID=UPI001CB9B4B1|nr:E3 ubiquitin-protein ligase MBR1-like [Erigeron canadensis]